MKRFIIAALMAGLVAVLSIAFQSGPSEALAGPFVGDWEATDVFDGSSMTQWIRADRGAYDVVLYDHLATSCDPDSPAVGFGRGVALGTVLLTRMEFWCLSAVPTYLGFGPGGISIYDPSSDTLTSIEGGGIVNVWHRR